MDMELKILLTVVFFSQYMLISCQNTEPFENHKTPVCDIEDMTEAKSAQSRATTNDCKKEIEKLACHLKKHQQVNIYSSEHLDSTDYFKLESNRMCLSNTDFKGCTSLNHISLLINKLETLKQEQNDSLETFNPNIKVKTSMSNHSSEVVSSKRCQNICLTLNHYRYAAYNNQTRDCYCFKNLTEKFELEKKCDPVVNNYGIYSTGFLDIKKIKEEYETRNQMEIQTIFESRKSSLPRIVFLLTLNGRSIRQIFRLIKTIYSDYHFYYIHIDKRMRYLHHEMNEFIKKSSNRENIFMPEWSKATMWGGTSLLQMHLRVLKDLLEMKRDSKWNWDFVLNLSETDFPIKSVQDLTLYLDKYRGKTFLRFHRGHYEKFFLNQAIEHAFLECDSHMWRVGARKLPLGIQFTGGSDWFCLNYEFVDYVVNSDHEYLTNLKSFYRNSLLPSESFFHTVYVNSEFCQQELADNHLKFVNWKRKRGCNCQHKNIVDWCGCSPNIINMENAAVLRELDKKPVFFARKFDPLLNHQLINMIDQSIFGLYSGNFKSLNAYWHNIYHPIDGESGITDSYRILFVEFLSIASQEFLDRLNALKKHLSSSSYMFDTLEFVLGSVEKSLKSIRRVEAFFEANKFRGFIINVLVDSRRNNVSFEYEAYFTPISSKQLISTNFNMTTNISSSLKAQLLQILTRFTVSTNFDTKEREFVNYASVMDQKSDPSLLIEFDPIEKEVEFWIKWTNPLNETAKELKVKLDRNEKSQLLVNKLFTADQEKYLKLPGIWKVSLSVSPFESPNNDTSTLDTIISREFLVLNNSSTTNEDILKFWPINDICIESVPNIRFKNTFLFDELFKQCPYVFWSTYFPDPKSDVLSNIKIDFGNRIIQ